jgi:hypothetical protein
VSKKKKERKPRNEITSSSKAKTAKIRLEVFKESPQKRRKKKMARSPHHLLVF